MYKLIRHELTLYLLRNLSCTIILFWMYSSGFEQVGYILLRTPPWMSQSTGKNQVNLHLGSLNYDSYFSYVKDSYKWNIKLPVRYIFIAIIKIGILPMFYLTYYFLKNTVFIKCEVNEL